MNLIQYRVRVEHDKFGEILSESFGDSIQFKLFLKMIHGCLELKNDLTFFNGVDFMVHVPYKHLVDSIVIANSSSYTAAEVLINKSKIEAEKTK